MGQDGRGRGAIALAAVTALAGCGGAGGDTETTEETTTITQAIRAGREPRLLAPLSTAISTSRRPLFHWQADGGHGPATLQICRDRGCRHPIANVDSHGAFARPAHALPAGVVFWRVLERRDHHTASSNVWELTIPARESGRVGSWGATPDF